MKYLLSNIRLLDPEKMTDFEGWLLVEDMKIAFIGSHGDGLADVSGIDVYDMEGCWLMPGLVDMHVHLRDPGYEYKETIKTGTMAAAAGGFTAVACMPNTKPCNDNITVTHYIISQAALAGYADVYPVAAITVGQNGKALTEFGDLISAGAVAFSDDGVPVADASVMRHALEYAKGFDTLIISHAEEPSLSKGSMNEGVVSTMLGLKGIPNACEDIAVFRDVCLAELTGARLHIAHVSTQGAVEIIRSAKRRGVQLTAETAPHYFTLTEEAVMDYNTSAKMNPPLRTEADRLAIIEGLKDGTIDVIATDHAPHSVLEKEKEFEAAANGIIGLETALPLSLELVRQGYLTPLELACKMSCNPVKILGKNGGSLKVGMPADLCIVDPNAIFAVEKDALLSKSHNTPWLGQKLQGRAVMTIKKGLITHNIKIKAKKGTNSE